MKDFDYTLEKKQQHAKAGVISTPHGKIHTPMFMPVGTQASVKALSPDDLEVMQSEIILGNTYHLYLRPGHELIGQFGGIHGFAKWDKPILTDSGGYQVSSLGLFKGTDKERLSKITEEGVEFKSHLDGSKHLITPEKAIEIQSFLGADIIMAFDEATPSIDKTYARDSMQRTHRWLKRCIDTWKEIEAEKGSNQKNQSHPQHSQALFGIIQGGNYEDLRRESAHFVLSQDLPGVAIGGATIGQSAIETEKNVSWIRDLIPDTKPLYLMGVGVHPIDVIEAVKSGADMFDCVAPTKLARTGILYHGNLHIPDNDIYRAEFRSVFEKARIQISWQQFTNDNQPILEGCQCYTCIKGFSRAYLRHLFKAHELLYYRLASIHNVHVMIDTSKRLRSAILSS